MVNKVTTKNYNILLFVVLYFIHFGGLVPLSTLFRGGGLTYELPILFFFLICSLNKKNVFDNYKKWLYLLLGTIILNYISTYFFEGRGILIAAGSSCFVHYLFLFFPLCVINPTIREVENVIFTIGLYLLFLYFLQQLLFPTPIIESLTSGWRINNNAGEFDLKRYSLGGEVLMYLFQFLCFNRFLIYKRNYYLVGVALVVLMSILHGYRSNIVAMLLSLSFLYFKVNGKKIDGKSITICVLILIFVQFIDQIPVVGKVIDQITEKNSNQFSQGNSLMDLDRIIELDFFYNQQLKSIWEWFFGCGFLSKDEYVSLPLAFYWINWVDLGFIGFSFMGGILMTFCWIRLLLLNVNGMPLQYKYLAAFSIFIICSTITLNTAFADQAVAVQALALCLGYNIKKNRR